MIDQAVETFGGLDVARQQRRHPARPHAHQHDRGGVGPRHQGPPARAPSRPLITRRPTGGNDRRPARPTTPGSSTRRRVSGIYGNVGQTNYGAAKQGIAALHVHRRPRARALRRDGERDRARRTHPAHRGPGHGRHVGPEASPRSSTPSTRPTSRRIVVWLGSTESRRHHRASLQRAGRPPERRRGLGRPDRRRTRATAGTRPSSARSCPTSWPRRRPNANMGGRRK